MVSTFTLFVSSHFIAQSREKGWSEINSIKKYLQNKNKIKIKTSKETS